MSRQALYYFVEADGRCRQIVNGVVTSLMNKKPITFAPIGHHDILIAWERVLTRWGQIRNFGLPQGYVMDAATILINDAITFNIDRQLFLLIQKLRHTITPTEFTDRYEFLYKGELDFSTFENDPSEKRVNINIMEGGNSKLLKAQEGTNFFLPFDSDAVNVKMDGMNIKGVYNFTIIEYTSGSTGALPTMVLKSQEQSAPGVAAFDINGGYSFPYSGIDAASTPYFMSFTTTPVGGTARFFGTINMSAPNPPDPANIAVWIYNTISDTLVQHPLFVGPEAAQIPIDIEIPVVKGDRLFLEIDEYHPESNLSVEIVNKFDQTIIKGFKLIDVFKKLCVKMGIAASLAVSTLLESSQIIFTSGDGIRGIPDSGIELNFNDFFKSVDAYYFAECSVRDTVEIESRLVAFNTNTVVPLGESAKFKMTPAIDLMFSSIKYGHREQDINDVNGKYDPNGFAIMTTPIKRGGGKQLDLTSPFKAGPYEIESIRANLDGKTTTDSDKDNQVFALAVADPQTTIETTVRFIASGNLMTFPVTDNLIAGMRIRITGSAAGNDREYIIQSIADGFIFNTATLDVSVTDEFSADVTIDILSGQIYSLDRSITVTAGIPDEAKTTIFNIPLTPKRLLDPHLRWIASFLYNYEPESIVFDHANRNGDLVAGGITESANIPIASMGPRIFLPWYFESKNPSPVDLVDILDTTPNAAFMPTWKGDEYTGFLWRAGISPNSQTPQVFKLLCAADTDITKLIS
jgi:hypothetical protein